MTSATLPALTIGMPIRNEGRFLREAVEAILLQDFEDFVLVISDNASDDDSESIGRELARQDERVRYQRLGSDIGALANFNRVARGCDTQFFMWAGGHDRALPFLLSQSVEVLRRDPTVVLVSALAYLIDADGTRIGVMPGFPDTRSRGSLHRFWGATVALKNGNPIYGMLRTEALGKTQLAIPVISADMILLSQLSALGSFARIDDPLWCRRETRSSESALQLVRRQTGSLFGERPAYGVFGAYVRLVVAHLLALGSVCRTPLRRVAFSAIVLLRYLVVVPWRWLVRRDGSVRVVGGSDADSAD